MGTTQQCIKSRRMVEELQGTARRAELAIHEGSHKAHKLQRRQPVVLYVVSPEVIHAEAGEFMALVQRLTGLEHSSTLPANAATASCLRVPPPPPPSSEVKRAPQFPMRVKARALNRSGEALRLTEPSSRSMSSVWSAWSGEGGDQGGGAASGTWLAREDRFIAPNLGNW